MLLGHRRHGVGIMAAASRTSGGRFTKDTHMRQKSFLRLSVPSLAVLTAVVVAATSTILSQPAAAQSLDPDDARALDRLFADGLFDPTGRPFVKFKLPVRDVWTGVRERDVYGWMVEPAKGTAVEPKATSAGRWAVLETGEAVPVMGDTTPVDFVKRCDVIMEVARNKALARQRRKAAAATQPATTKPTRFGLVAEGDDEDGDDDADGEDHAGRRLWPGVDQGFAEARPAAYLAAWLRRAGRDDTAAARMLALARTASPAATTRPLTKTEAAESFAELAALTGPIPRRNDPWYWFSRAVHAYMVRADAEALFYLRHMVEYHPAAMEPPAKDRGGDKARNERVYSQAKLLLAELERRQKEGTFGVAPIGAATQPAQISSWPVDRRVAYLIGQLQEVDARQSGQPGGVDLGSDPRVAALIEIGDAAVPALIDCVERDERLTRSVHFWRDFSNDRTVLGVREAALTAVMSILRTTVFQTVSTGDNFTTRGEETAKATAARLRAYWKANGHIPFDERMMAALTNVNTSPEAWREAASNLANLGGQRTIGTTVWSGRVKDREAGTGNPAIAKFKNPTVAEAILAAMDRDLARHDAQPEDPRMHDYHRRRIESQYVDTLIELKDRSIVPALLKRLEKPPSLRERRLLAVTCFTLGDVRPLTGFAADVRDGRVTISNAREPNTNENEQPWAIEMSGIVDTLTRASQAIPMANAALWAMSDPVHPLHALAEKGVRSARRSYDDRVWLAHPFCLRFLRADLDDVTPTGKTYRVERDADGDRLTHQGGNGSGSTGLPQFLADPAGRRERAEERACDSAAERISGMILGVRPCHPLLKDEDGRVAELRAFLDAYLPHLRRATYAETQVVGVRDFSNVAFVLNVRALAAGATADDVRAGAAIFHLDGKGTPLPDLHLPASAVLKADRPPLREPGPADVAAGRAREYFRSGGTDAAADQPRRVIEWVVPRVLVLQAERGPDGKAHYGIVSAEGTRGVSEEDVSEVKTLGSE